jgi:hypothetical protein
MASERVADLTMQELKALINRTLEERLRLGFRHRQPDRPVAEVLESMRKNIIKRKPGQPTTLQMLREDRDR